MPIPHPTITETIRHLPTTVRVDCRRRLNALAFDEVARLVTRYGERATTETARQRLVRYAGALELNDIGRTRHAIAAAVFRQLRNSWQKPKGLIGYENRNR